MRATADASFLISLYGGDLHTPLARAWMVREASPVILTSPARFETENALRLACHRGLLSPAELRQSLAQINEDIQLGFLVEKEVSTAVLWQECRRLSATHTLELGMRAFDIIHIGASKLARATTFLTFDERQASLARAVGLSVPWEV